MDPITQAPVFLTSAQRTSTGVRLAEAAAQRGLDTVVWSGSATEGLPVGRAVHWYGGPLAADRITARLGLGLLEPADEWLAALPRAFTGRRVELTTLSEAWAARHPVFVKPPSDKQFPAAVHPDGSRLPRTGERIGPDTPVLVCEPVTFACEYRLFVLDRQVAAGSRYARYGQLDIAPLTGDPNEAAVRGFAAALLADCADTLPSAVVVDVGLMQDPDTGDERWAVVEANMPWFAHSYAAEPDPVLDVVLRSAGPLDAVAPADRRFLRDALPPRRDR